MERVWWYLGLVGVVWCVANCGRETIAPSGEDEVAELKGQALEDYKRKLAVKKAIEVSEIDGRTRLGGSQIDGGGPIYGHSLPTGFQVSGDAFFGLIDSPIPGPAIWYEHRHSGIILTEAASKSTFPNGGITFSGSGSSGSPFNPSVWNVDSANLTQRTCRVPPSASGNYYVEWDANMDDIADVPMPIEQSMWGEPYPGADGHICVVDLALGKVWELSRYQWNGGNPVYATTFNIWDLGPLETGYHEPLWTSFVYGATSRGGRGGGTMVLSTLLRVEELKTFTVNHAMGFTYEGVKSRAPQASNKKLFAYPPCVRADQQESGRTADKYMTYGLRARLDPDLPITYFTSTLGITNPYVLYLVEVLQQYGAYLHDFGGGGWKFARELRGTNAQGIPDLPSDVAWWKAEFGNNFFTDFNKIRTGDFIVLSCTTQNEVWWNTSTGDVEIVFDGSVGP